MKKCLRYVCLLLSAVLLVGCGPKNESKVPSIKVETEYKTERETKVTATKEETELQTSDTEYAIKSTAPLNSWRGVYVYDDGSYGEVLIVKTSNDTNVTGQYIYPYENGDYGIRDFEWKKTDGNTHQAREPFQNRTDFVYYETGDNEITALYPDGWYADKHFTYRCSVEDMMDVIKHPALGNATLVTDSVTQPFYGIWTMGSKAESDAIQTADLLNSQGFNAKVYVTTDWSNLNPELWYVVSAGEYPSEDAAYAALTDVQNTGYSTAYVKYTGEYLR